MTLQITSAWEHDIFGALEGSSHLVVTISAPDASAGTRAPVDLAFALDRSGSMSGDRKLELVKLAVLAAVEQLRDTDQVTLVTFDDEVKLEHRLTPVDADHRRHLHRVTRAIECGGSTNLSGGWLEACRQLSGGPTQSPRVRRALLLTDGQANEGITDAGELGRHARELRDRGISTSAIGVGYGFDELLLSDMVRNGGGNFQYIAHPSELEAFFSQELRSLAQVAAMNPYLDVTLPQGMRAELLNAFPSEDHRLHTSVDLRDLAAGDVIHLVFAVTSRHQRAEHVMPNLHLHWTNPATGTVEEINQDGAMIAVGDASRATRNDAAAALVAMELSARDHREAVKLDREGRYRESRDRFARSVNRLQAAPQTAEVREEYLESQRLAMMSPAAAMSEHERKGRVYKAQMRSRGGRSPQPGEPGNDQQPARPGKGSSR